MTEKISSRKSLARNALVFNSTAMKHASLVMEIVEARRAGYAGIETTVEKVRAYLDAGHSVENLKDELGDLVIYGLGTIVNIERHGVELDALRGEAHEIFGLANLIGARGVQVITGPLDHREVERYNAKLPVGNYRGTLEYSSENQLKIAAENLAMLADMAARFGIVVYLEALGWAPLNKLSQQVETLRRADRKNLKLVVDFWHCYVSGDGPADVALLDKDLIYGVHLDDSLIYEGGVPNETILRDVQTGMGVLDLHAWSMAVKATGYEGWWSSETFCRKWQQSNSSLIVPEMNCQLKGLVNG